MPANQDFINLVQAERRKTLRYLESLDLILSEAGIAPDGAVSDGALVSSPDAADENMNMSDNGQKPGLRHSIRSVVGRYPKGLERKTLNAQMKEMGFEVATVSGEVTRMLSLEKLATTKSGRIQLPKET